MAPLGLVLLAAAAAGVIAQSDEMGPAAFWWPADRPWTQDSDNTAPCGSSSGVTTRTEFPLSGGVVAITAQDDSHTVHFKISFNNDPKTQSDFTFNSNSIPLKEIDPGHTCLRISDPPTGISPGTNATIQMQYTADFDRPENQTFYACTDITYVRADAFSAAQIPCFNATSDVNVPAPSGTGIPDDLPGHGDNEPALTTAKPVNSGGGGVVLSKGAIAGIAIGAVVGVSLIAGLALLFYRERQKKERLVRQRDSGRGVQWSEDPPKDSASAGSFRLGNMPSREGPAK